MQPETPSSTQLAYGVTGDNPISDREDAQNFGTVRSESWSYDSRSTFYRAGVSNRSQSCSHVQWSCGLSPCLSLPKRGDICGNCYTVWWTTPCGVAQFRSESSCIPSYSTGFLEAQKATSKSYGGRVPCSIEAPQGAIQNDGSATTVPRFAGVGTARAAMAGCRLDGLEAQC